MSRTKTKYKKYADGGAVPLNVEIDTDVAHVNADAATEQLLAAAESPDNVSVDIPESDDASKAFQKQIDDLRRAEQVQRDRSAEPAQATVSHSAAQAPLTHHQRVAYWRDKGADEGEAEYFTAQFEHPEITHRAAEEAVRMGHNPGTDGFHGAVYTNFLKGLNAARPLEPEPVLEPEPAPVARKKRVDSDPPHNRSSLVSAPVSRDTVANGGYNSYGDRPGRVTLSKAQLEAAAFSGITPKEYAEQLLRLREEQKNGNYHGGQP
jgi:hypothetical protein